MSTVHRQQHSFSTHERMFLWKFLRKKMSQPEGDSNPRTFGFMMSNALTISQLTGPDISCLDVLEHWLWRTRYFSL